MLKHWQSYSLQQQLLEYVAKGQDEVVILKIPTAKLDPDKLIIRSQKRLFDWRCSVDGAAAIEKADTAMEKETGQHKWLEKYREIFKVLFYKILHNINPKKQLLI